jgi:hypothetical protein
MRILRHLLFTAAVVVTALCTQALAESDELSTRNEALNTQRILKTRRPVTGPGKRNLMRVGGDGQTLEPSTAPRKLKSKVSGAGHTGDPSLPVSQFLSA